LAEIGEVGFKVEKIDLNAVTARLFQLNKLLDYVLRRPQNMDVAAENPLIALVPDP
jgi:hypothetical protein